MLAGCSENSTTISRAQGQIQGVERQMIEVVTIAEKNLQAHVSDDTLKAIQSDLTAYFKATNEARWDDLMHYFPMHKKQGDTAFVNGSKRALEHWTERGVQNRTAAAEIVYTSPVYRDNDQDVVLLNLDLSHFVEFHRNYDGPRPNGMKGMVETNYGKGNATYRESGIAPGDSIPELRYWEVAGYSRIWAVSHVDSVHWCFLPPNFNETGAAGMMGANAMVEALRHRRANDSTSQK
jgi:hypothetical protein